MEKHTESTSDLGTPAPHRAGFAAIIGAPNAGKSTLLNRLVGEKISIVSPRAQTTRMRVLGIMTDGEAQIGLVDTPGIFAPRHKFEKAMVKVAWDALSDADIVLVIVDASVRQPDEKTAAIVTEIARRHLTATLVLNKIDKVPPSRLLPLAADLNASGCFKATFMISSLTGEGVADLRQTISAAMPRGEWLFPPDQLSDLPARLLAAETTREQLFLRLREELPYAATVLPVEWEERDDGSVIIHQKIVVERANHRAIILGRGGEMIKTIGQASRRSLTTAMGRPVHLFLEVKLDPHWRDRPAVYRLFGLQGE